MDFPEGHMNLFVTDIGEPAENSLRIVVSEGLQGQTSPIKFGDIDLGEGRPIEVTSESRHFELNWDSYVAYAVRNESFWKAEPQEPRVIGQLNRRVNSAFLEFVSTTTFADDKYPGPLQHWALNTLTHCVDVVSVQPPRVQQVKA
jgi:hypothetical protein